MSRFFKSMVAIAASALVAGPAVAQDFETFNTTWSGSNAQANLTGAGCRADNTSKLNMTVNMRNEPVSMDPDFLDFVTGPNTGIWESSILGFGGELDGEGTFVISQRGNTVIDAPKKAAVGPSDNLFLALVNIVAGYAVAECNNLAEFDGDLCQVHKGDATWSMNGERLTVRMDMKCRYLDQNGRNRNVQLKIHSGRLDFVE